jgi:3-methyladenine DNA glycosylase AlkD
MGDDPRQDGARVPTSVIVALQQSIAEQLAEAGLGSGYLADANEQDPRYRSYGARAAAKSRVIKAHRAAVRELTDDQKLDLATCLIESRYGEQQSVAMYVLEQMPDYFHPGNLGIIDAFIRYMHGWSKIDSFTGGLLADLLFRYPKPVIALADEWNEDPDLWLRRASVALFTRKVAASRRFTDIALELCENLAFDPERMVQRAVGWSLKDLIRSDRQRVGPVVERLRSAGAPGIITRGALQVAHATR